MLSYPDALAYQVVAAQKKTTAATRIGSYTIASMLGGAYIGVAVVLMLTAAGPFFDNNSPATKLVSGLVFGVALSLVTVAGGELVTSNMMTLTQGLSQKAITINVWGRTLTVNFLGNLLGGIAFGTLVWLSESPTKAHLPTPTWNLSSPPKPQNPSLNSSSGRCCVTSWCAWPSGAASASKAKLPASS